MKVSELTGAELDYWVAKAEGDDPDNAFYRKRYDGMVIIERVTKEEAEKKCRGGFTVRHDLKAYSTDWRHAGPIIERELIELCHDRDYREDGTFGRVWQANVCGGWWDGDTPLIAAMRCYVASKFGEEVPAAEVESRP